MSAGCAGHSCFAEPRSAGRRAGGGAEGLRQKDQDSSAAGTSSWDSGLPACLWLGVEWGGGGGYKAGGEQGGAPPGLDADRPQDGIVL